MAWTCLDGGAFYQVKLDENNWIVLKIISTVVLCSYQGIQHMARSNNAKNRYIDLEFRRLFYVI